MADPKPLTIIEAYAWIGTEDIDFILGIKTKAHLA